MTQEKIPFWYPFTSGDKIPKNAVIGGRLKNNEVQYIGRSFHNGSLTPGRVSASNKDLSLPWGCIENIKSDFEILVNGSTENWVVAQKGEVPLSAFPAGHAEYSNETLFIGRVVHEGHLLIGKIQPSHRVCYIAYETMEISFEDYEVYVV